MKKFRLIILSVTVISLTACGTVAKGPDPGTQIFNPDVIAQAAEQNSNSDNQNTDVEINVDDKGEDITETETGEENTTSGEANTKPNTVDPREAEPYNPTQDSYYKKATLEDVETASDGTKYIKNQILISTEPGTADDFIAALSEEYNFEIVGKITFTGDYQIEFNEAKTYEELRALIEEFKQLDWVKFCSLNVGIPTS